VVIHSQFTDTDWNTHGILSTWVAPKVMPPTGFHGNYNCYKEHNSTVWQSCIFGCRENIQKVKLLVTDLDLWLKEAEAVGRYRTVQIFCLVSSSEVHCLQWLSHSQYQAGIFLVSEQISSYFVPKNLFFSYYKKPIRDNTYLMWF